MARAIYILRHGEPEELVAQDHSVPSPQSREVSIDVHAAGVNFPDLLVVRGVYHNLAALPFSPGKEIAGLVREVGSDVSEFRIGQPVLCYVENGGYADQITVPVDLCHPVPNGLDFADAIGFGLGYQTAHFALFARGQLKAGETVLITGATGVVGISAVALAKACGAVVIAGCTTRSKASFVRQHGADHIVMLNDANLKKTLRDEVSALTDGRGVDVVIDNLGGFVFDACLRTLTWCGRIVVVGFAADAPASIRSNYLLIKNISATGLHWSDYRDRTPTLVQQAQSHIHELWEKGSLVSPVTKAFRLDNAALALRNIANRHALGKTVLLTDHYAGRFGSP